MSLNEPRTDVPQNADIIAIETSSQHGSVALAHGGELLGQRHFATNKDHARDLLPAVDSLCREHGRTPQDISQCHLSIGPGSFTGLRVAVSFARHLALATGAKLCAVPTLDVIAENVANTDNPPQYLAVILDAKRRQVFAAVYEHANGTYRRTIDAKMVEPGALFAEAPSPIAVTGEGIPYHKEAIEASNATIVDEKLWKPLAVHVHGLGLRIAQRGEFTDAQNLTPFYIRRPEAEELWEKRHA